MKRSFYSLFVVCMLATGLISCQAQPSAAVHRVSVNTGIVSTNSVDNGYRLEIQNSDPTLSTYIANAQQEFAIAYPQLVTRWAANPNTAPRVVTLKFVKNLGAAAETSSDLIQVDLDYAHTNPYDPGVLTHELTHVVQGYPTYVVWLTEAIANYSSQLYGPRREEVFRSASKFIPNTTYLSDPYDTGSRFLFWLAQNKRHDIVDRLNRILQANTYTPTVFVQLTGKTLDQLWAQYLIAADGNRSSIREALGIQTRGPGAISYTTDVAFEADLREVLGGRRIYLYYVSNPHLPDGMGGLMPLDNELRWSFGFPIHPELGERREDQTDERCIELIRIAVGIPDLEVKILPAYPWDSVKVGVWELSARYAERYQKGRVFLAGDAAHTVLPSGGLGAGTGIQDAFNLAWKLALALAGKAGTALLASYEEERLPIGNLTVEQTLQRHFYRTGTAESTLIDYSELIFGYRYRSSAQSEYGEHWHQDHVGGAQRGYPHVE